MQPIVNTLILIEMLAHYPKIDLGLFGCDLINMEKTPANNAN